MAGWEDWQVAIVLTLFAAKWFVIGSIWGEMRARRRARTIQQRERL